MRGLLIGCVLGALVVSLSACGGSGGDSASEQTLQRKADFWEIDQIERKFHEATTKKDIDLMMSLFSPNATLTVGGGRTAAGKKQIRQYFLTKSVFFEPTNHWISDHPAYKLRITVNGDRGTLHFECHYVDAKTKKVVVVVAADQEVARIDGRWLITDMVGGSTTLRA
jgi:ketosteroid isomerase-like protein